MKKYLLVFFLIIVAVIPAAAAETGGSFTIGNNNLPEEEMDSADFKGMDFLWGMSAFWEKEANDISGIRVGFYRDTVLKNLAYTNFYYNDDLFNIEVGPFFGLFNTAQTMIKSGISTAVKINIPGIAYARFYTQSTIGGTLVNTGDYIQEANNISIGFYVPNAICTLMIDTKGFTSVTDSGPQTDEFTEYAFVSDIFQKNMPYTVTLKIAYQAKTRTIEDTSVLSLNNIVLGTDVTFSPFDFLSIDAGLESCLYSFGSLEDLVADTSSLLSFADELPGSFLFNATLGVTLDLDNINN